MGGRCLKALLRFALDAIYVVCFFAIMLAGAIGVHWLAGFLGRFGSDSVVVWMVRQLERFLVLVDVIGVICGSVVSLFRFVRALADEASGKRS